ncbi:hypothetical protein [Lentilitoribacter sp. Alg239-R112]|uniref:hypothetical protein n=1 Tax=Lentilitoribacter sp. Alg239-R112 TaxID=2305987 RepID=UPI0013A6D931|nr:hypothetical protein [Lentilitoribacter sp. Alg239-R112]
MTNQPELKPCPRLPVLRTPEGIVKSLEQWVEFTRRDDCLRRMVPSDLRVILSNLKTREAPKVKALEFVDSKAEGCNIIYNIKKWPNSEKYRVMFNRFGGIDWLMDKFDSWHGARVAAQSHYGKLILEALEK